MRGAVRGVGRRVVRGAVRGVGRRVVRGVVRGVRGVASTYISK